MAERRARSARDAAPSLAQHFLAGRALAAELVAAAGIGGEDLVLDIGAGRGVITAELARRARHVHAIELDPRLAVYLRRRFRGVPNVEVVEGNVLRLALPEEPFAAVSNVPFNRTTALLRRLLDDPAQALRMADLVVQVGAAQKRAATCPGTLLTTTWSPWYRFEVGRRIHRSSFCPPPTVDAAILRIRQREPPLLPIAKRGAFTSLVAAGFSAPNGSLRAGLTSALTPRQFRTAATRIGFARGAAARELRLDEWLALYALVSGWGPATTRRTPAARRSGRSADPRAQGRRQRAARAR